MRYAILVAVVAVGGVIGCGNSQRADRETVEKQQQIYAKSQPIPMFDFSQERDTAIQLYKMRNEKVRTWTVWRSATGVIEGDCESRGFPLPYDVQLTNPKMIDRNSSAVIEQPEPNGLFSSKGTSATWVRAIIDGKEVPLYIETKVTCYPYPVIVDYEKNRVVRVSGKEPSAVLKEGK